MKYVIGLIIGLYLGVASHAGNGYLLGGVLGVLFVIIFDLKAKVTELEKKLNQRSSNNLKQQSTPLREQVPELTQPFVEKEKQNESLSLNHSESKSDQSSDSGIESPSDDLDEIESSIEKELIVEEENDVLTELFEESYKDFPMGEDEEVVLKEKEPQVIREPSLVEKAFTKAKSMIVDYFTGGNLIVRIGLLILFVGVAFLLKYVAERTTVPVEWRYIGIILGSAVLFGMGWKLRVKRPGYALSLIGGGLGVLYLTLFAAMRLHGLLSPETVIILLISVVVITAVVSILTNSMALAVIGMVGGYAAPILASTGSGSHVQLFTYYLFLNLGIFAIAWFKSWRILNLLGFVATFGIGSLWGHKFYSPEYYVSVQPFLIVNFLLYTLIAVLFSMKQPPKLKGLTDGTLIFGTPLVGFSLQAALMKGSDYGLATSALILSVFYISLSFVLIQLKKAHLKSLVESFIALGIGFSTLAIPLAFDGRVTSAMWVAEACALVWVGVRQQRVLPRWSGYALALLGSFAFFTEPVRVNDVIPWFNANFIGALTIVLSCFFIGMYVRQNKEKLFAIEKSMVPRFMVIFSLIWWLVSGLYEVYQYHFEIKQTFSQWFLILTSVLLIHFYKRSGFELLKWSSLIVSLGMLIAMLLIPREYEVVMAFTNDRFIGILSLALFHFWLSWFWRESNKTGMIPLNNRIQRVFLSTSVLVWLFGFGNEFHTYFHSIDIVLIEGMMAITAVALLLFGLRTHVENYKVGSVIVTLLMMVPILLLSDKEKADSFLFDVSWIGFVIYALTQLSMSWYWQRAQYEKSQQLHSWSLSVSHLMLITGLLAWYLKGIHVFSEYFDYLSLPFIDHVFVILSTAIFVLMAHRLKWQALHFVQMAYLPFLVVFAFWSLTFIGDFHQNYAWLAWVSAAAFSLWLLKRYDGFHAYNGLYHLFNLILFVFVLVFELNQAVQVWQGSDTIWSHAISLFALSAISLALFYQKSTTSWPFANYKQYYLNIGLGVFILVLCLMFLVIQLSHPGHSTLIPYLPVANIIDISSLLSLVLVWKWLHSNLHTLQAEWKRLAIIVFIGMSFLLINASLMRSFHYWYNIAYEFSDLWSTNAIQTSLSILWTVTAMILMVVSSKKQWRKEWMLGFGLILIVVIKLFLIDMSASGTIERIVAFLTVGVLLSVIGYFSPLPPNNESESQTKSDSTHDDY
jgi:uncharacterized membrane protein